MQLCLVGINHQSAPVALREKVAIGVDGLPEALSTLRSSCEYGIILSTCNRTEVYSLEGEGHDTEGTGMRFLKDRAGRNGADLLKHAYFMKDEALAEHLFRVASGLESMITGEYEVLGQVRQALEAAEAAGMVDLPLRQVFQGAIRTGRRVREETALSKNALSVSSVAVDMAAAITGDLSQCRLLVIGAGEAGKLVAKVAKERGVSRIVVASRTWRRAQAAAQGLGAIPADLSQLAEELETANIIVTCAGAPHQLLDQENISRAMRQRPGIPLVIIDIAVPRNVAPEAGSIDNVFLYNIDALNRRAELNRCQRQGEIEKAEAIIAVELGKFNAWWCDLAVRPLISALMSKADEIRAAQLDKTLKKLPALSDEQRENLEAMTCAIVTRLLHDPIEYLKNNRNGPSEIIRELFHLTAEPPQ